MTAEGCYLWIAPNANVAVTETTKTNVPLVGKISVVVRAVAFAEC
ncbi:MAG: hypothetical protein ABFC57_12735 [Veillonellales bacterium]